MENWRECCPMSRESLSPSGWVAVYDNVCARMYIVAVRFQRFLFFFPRSVFLFLFLALMSFRYFPSPDDVEIDELLWPGG
jgi:hypothetical protein